MFGLNRDETMVFVCFVVGATLVAVILIAAIIAFLKTRKSNEGVERLRAEVDRLREDVERLKRTYEDGRPLKPALFPGDTGISEHLG